MIATQATMAAADAVAFYPVAESASWAATTKKTLNAELDRIGCPPEVRRLIPIVKASAAAGLLIGLRRPKLGRLTATAIVAYFVVALACHARAKDPIAKYVPAAALFFWAVLVQRRMTART